MKNLQTKSKKLAHIRLPNIGFGRLKQAPARTAAASSINILTLESPAATALGMLLADFQRYTGIQTNLTILAFDELYNTICTMGDSGYYDLIRLDVAWLSHLAEHIYLPLEETSLDLKALMSSLIEETGTRFTTVNNTLYTLPFDPSIQMLFYRSDLFEDAMVKRQYYERYREELSVPKTYSQYNKTAAFFTKTINPSSPVEYGTTMTFGSSSVAACDFMPRILAMGQSIFDEHDRLAINTPAFTTAMEDYMETYRCTDRSVNMWWKQSVENFSTGNTAMTITFNNHASYLINSKHSHVVDRLGFAMVPGGRPLLGGGVIGISKASKNREAACEFLKWVYSDEISGMITALGGTSANRFVYTNGEITSLFPWLETARRSFSWGTRGTETQHYPQFNQKVFENILGTAVRNCVTGIMPVQDALDYAQKILEQTFKFLY